VRILSRYFALRFLGLFLAILFVSTLSIVVVEMLLNFDLMTGDEAGPLGILTYFFLRIPSYYLRDLVPIATFAAAFFALGLAAHWLELTASKAGGVSTLRILAPILLAAVALGCVTFIANETVVVEATRGWNRELAGGNRTISFRRGRFWYHRGQTIYKIGSANRAEHTLRDVTIYELSPKGRLLRSVHARAAHIEDDPEWDLEEATIRRFDPASPERPPQFERVAHTSISLKQSSGDALLDADAGGLSLPDLAVYIDRQQGAGEDVGREQALFHARLSDPVTVLVFALLALPLALRVESTRSLATPAVYGVATVAAFFAVKNTALTLASESVIPAAAGAWAPLGAFGLLGLWQIRRER
jgi:lipopolysaccharide export system permease protein